MTADDTNPPSLSITLALLRPSSIYWHVEMAALEEFLSTRGAWGEDEPILLADLINSHLPLKLTLWCLYKARPTAAVNRIARSFAADCAERVLPVFLDVSRDDDRPAVAIATAREASVSGDLVGLEEAERGAKAAAEQLRSEGLAMNKAARGSGKHLVRAGSAAQVAADCCQAHAGEAAYQAPIRAATYVYGRDPGLPMGPDWERETAWQTQCLLGYLSGA